MSITEAARARARAAVSAAQAEVIDLEAQLAQAHRTLEGSQVAEELLDSVRETPLVGSLTAGKRDQTAVDKAKATADIDRITSELSGSRMKLDLARKAESLILSATGAGADEQETPDQPTEESGDDESSADNSNTPEPGAESPA